ncbi:hypothetical protein COCON_G00045330 [Conger conger]|uniref:Uncharacterized protein n=1 Tax=Conger conger TaxID=82655 RepID=A0A9Q1I496_CONCO|nr:hypothetical protein COCON_G00045330 [Conger conger]
MADKNHPKIPPTNKPQKSEEGSNTHVSVYTAFNSQEEERALALLLRIELCNKFKWSCGYPTRSFSAPIMKPPSRKRSVPLRFVSREPELKRRDTVRAGWFGWKWNERHILLVELKRQHKNAELDLVALQSKLPKRSLQEIESFVQFLKSVVGKRVARLVNKLRQDQLSDKAPIELWTEMSQKMAGSQEAAISSAFSQMLVIAATEPCSLLNSDPPRSLSTPKQLPSNLQKVTLRPMARPPATTSSMCMTPRVHASTQLSSELGH